MKSIPVVGGLSRSYSLCGAILVAAVLGLATLALGLVGAKSASAQDVASSQAAFFDANTDTIQVSGQTVIGTTSTYEAVISLSSAPDRQSLVFNEWTANAEDKQLQAGPSRLMGYNYGGGSPIVADSPTLSVDTWHHVAYVYDGNQQRLYLNGTLVDSQAGGGEVGDGSGLAHVGAIFRDGRINTGFVGYIDSLRISDVARYSGTSFTPPSGDMASDANTQLLYNFNDPADSTTVQDSGPLGRTGTLGAGFTGATSPQLGAPGAPVPQDEDTTAPRVTGTKPANKATGVARNTPLTATFSEQMNPNTLTKATFKLFKVNSDGTLTRIRNTTVTPSTDGLKATLDPYGTSTTLLRANTKYKAIVTIGAEDLAGNALDQNSTRTGNQKKVWTFTTGSS